MPKRYLDELSGGEAKTSSGCERATRNGRKGQLRSSVEDSSVSDN
jgi:hypothetical protein